MNNEFKVLHIMSQLYPSGMERMLYSSSSLWKTHGIDVTILGTGVKHPYAQTLADAGYHVHTLGELRTIPAFLELFAYIRRNDFKLIHNHNESLHGIIGLIVKIANPRSYFVHSVHSIYHFSGWNRMKRRINHALVRALHGVFISPSAEVQEFESKYWGTKSILVENWVDVPMITELRNKKSIKPNDGFVFIGLIGNCSEIKCHELALKALEWIDEIKVHHVGDIQNATPLERALVLQFEKDSRIQMHGNVASAVEIMTFCDALIVSSVVEGFSLVIAEGLILGLPIFVRNVSGVQWSRNLQGVVFFQDGQELTHKLNEFLDSPWNYSSNNEMQEFEFRFAPIRGVEQLVNIYRREI